jgi:hypothetical protein
MTTFRTPRRLIAATAVVALSIGTVAACGSDDKDESSDTTQAAPAAELQVSNAWARTSASMATAGAVYLEITNAGDADDSLVGVSVDAAVAAKAELHETVEAEAPMGSDTTMGSETTMAGGEGTETTMAGGMMEMRPVDMIAVPAGDTVTLEPGGYHIMLLELAAPLEVGTTIDVTLTFENAGDQVVTAEVRDTAP